MGELAKTVIDVHTIIETIDDEDALRQINQFVLARLKGVRTSAADNIGWRVDMKVQLKPRHRKTKPWDGVGKVVKVNRVKLHIDFPPYGIYVVPKPMVQEAP